MVLLQGCGDDPWMRKVPLEPQQTAEAAVFKAIDSLHDVDIDGFLSCFEAREDEYLLLESVISAGNAAVAFRKKFISTYGEKAWESFQDPEQSPEGADGSLQMIEKHHVDEIKAWQYNHENPEVTFPNSQGPIRIKESHQGFVLSPGNILNDMSSKSLEGNTKLMNTLTEMVSRHTQAIGQPHLSPQDIDFQFGKDLMKTIFGMEVGLADKYDVDAIGR